ncbi:MAG TPA: tRNA dihydrouridine synthase DusB [Sporichthyaceae bacterium]|nr:tRNA dihydrouridine synthase DusB [Sporichthyaceae bacterium]
MRGETHEVIEAAALRLGRYEVWPPVVLAPMAGITNRAFRTLCREAASACDERGPRAEDKRATGIAAGESGADQAGCPGLYVNEMVTARGLVERDRATWAMVRFAPEEQPRSLQLYGTDAASIGAAVRLVVAEDLADHVDLNFGCPVPKVTRKGGGAALPYKRRLFAGVVAAAVTGADGRIPVTVKMRMGIDDEHLTYLDAGRIAATEGVAWVALHARTAAQHYSGNADWSAIARLSDALEVPVLGNGDIWEAADALAMMAVTGCAGVVVGRGCLGRPWLFGNLAAVFAGRPDPGHPGLARVAATLRRHARLMAADGGERWAACEIRKHIAWYLKGFAVGPALRGALGLVESMAELDDLLDRLDADQPFPAESVGVPRGRAGSPRQVALPDGWLTDQLDGQVQEEERGTFVIAGG